MVVAWTTWAGILSSSEYILKEEPRAREREESQITPRTLARTTGRMEVPVNKVRILRSWCVRCAKGEMPLGVEQSFRWGPRTLSTFSHRALF